MARPLAYDPDLVTDRALGLFWRMGYDGASISDLTGACGINRQSLYNRFTDKRGAFRAALARYSELLDQALAPLAGPGAGLPDLIAFIRQTLALQQTMDTGACLLVITAFGPQIADPDIRQAVEDGATRTRAAFAAVLARAGTPDPAAAAAYLYAVMTGLSALSRTGGAARIDDTLTFAFRTLTPKDPAP
jgi:TetR/AcrR family transcriptional regulator, transcriptional repressor for nem operon